MASDKAKKLYDKKPAGDKEAAATAEADMEAGDKPRADSEAKPKGGEAAAVAKVESLSEKFLKASKDMRGRHETERRDFHGTIKNQLRDMATRHEEEIAALLNAIGNTDGEEGTGTQVAEAAMADGGAMSGEA